MEPKSTASAVAVSLLSISLTFKLIAVLGCIIVGAGASAYVSLKAAKRENQEFGKMDVFGSFLVAFFSGGMFFVAAVWLLDNWFAVWFAAGMGAFMGITGISKIGDAFIDVLTNLASKQR